MSRFGVKTLALAIGVTAAALMATSCNSSKQDNAGAEAPDPGDVKAIAEEAFIYGLPIVMNYAVMNELALNKDSGQYKAPFNTIASEARVFTYQDTAVVTPNSDTPYSMLWLDLRAEPVVISVPAVEKNRYFSVQLTDGNTYNYGYIGSRTTGNDGGDYLVAGPDWNGEPPEGIKQVFRATTPFGLTIFRTQLFNPDDLANVKKIQSGYRVQPLSAFLNRPPPPAPAQVSFPPASNAGIKSEFFDYLDAALQFVPESPQDKAIRAKLAGLGIGTDAPFAFKDQPAARKAAMMLGMKAGAEKLDAFLNSNGKTINGWKIGSMFGDAAFYDGNWLMRAAAAKAGIYGNNADEAVYPMALTDADGEALDGSKHKYTLTFGAGQLPPVNAFWSVTMYDGTTQLLIENPINRYLINSPMLPGMKSNADGSLTLYIQKDSPGKDKEANWLPAPNGPIYMVMRLYWPKTGNPSVLPAGSGTWSPPPVVRVD